MKRQHDNSLDFIKGVYADRKTQWDIGRAQALIDAIKTSMAMPNGVYKFNMEKAIEVTGMKKSSIVNFIKELKEANRMGWSLEEYFYQGRPFRYGKEKV